MKNTLKFLGLIAIVAVIGFSMAACSSGGGGGGGNDTYSGGAIIISVSSFRSAFSGTSGASATDTSPLSFIEGDVNSLRQKADTAWDSKYSGKWGEGGTIGDLRDWCKDNTEGYLSDAQIEEIINKLKTNGYVVAYMGAGSGTGMIGCIAGVKD